MNRGVGVHKVIALVMLAGCGSPIVGAECAEGFVPCDNVCVSLESDRLNCGACGTICSVEQLCIQGSCAVPPDADMDASVDGSMDMLLDRFVDGNNFFDANDGDPDGGGDGGGDGDGGDGGGDGDGGDGGGDGDGGDGGGDGDVDGGPPVCACDIGEQCCSDVCVQPDRDPANCGGCGIRCGAAEFCADSSCEPICAAPLELCGAVCIDTTSDRDNCGGCGIRCASGICQDSACASSSEGHVILIGHDFTVGRTGQNFLAGNSVFIPLGDQVEVLVYEGDATRAAINGVDRAIDLVADRLGRSWSRTVTANVDDVPRLLGDAQVFLVYAQQGATDDALQSAGATWGTAFMSFLRRGGVIVVFDGDGANTGTYQLLGAAGLFDAGPKVDITGQIVTVVDRGDIIARSVPASYLGEEDTVHFMSAPSGAVVVEHPDGPVVIHEVLSP
ncbi:MAG: hypothetical protein AAF645_07510 [Myxococcota bacterium]